MKTVLWKSLTEQQKQKILARHAIDDNEHLTEIVTEVLNLVKKEGDAALYAYTEKFDKVELKQIPVAKADIASAGDRISQEMKDALQHAYKNIQTFHAAQKHKTLSVETQKGVLCELETRPISKVGLYIPGGSAPLVSTALMLGVPAQIAGCKQVVLCSPPPIADEILYVASLCGITEVYNVGGAQAVAALAYGTESVPKVDKIFGPGNSFVTEAKRLVSNDINGASIDMPAGPSEVLIIADDNANDNFIAADLLSQAEHGADSQVFLLTCSTRLAHEVAEAVRSQLPKLSRRNLAQQSLIGSAIIVTDSLEESIEISNDYGPEHLIIQTDSPRSVLPRIDNAGSVFLGAWSPESVGDYASGTNHVLPTYGYTKTYSSLGLADFSKRMTVQELSPEGLQGLAQTVTIMAEAEGLDAHKNAITVRMDKLSSIKDDA